jgi:hypothetical protein
LKPGDIVFLSAGVPSRPGWVDDAKPTEVEEAVISVARAVFARQGRLLFGGHPSISPLVSSVAGEYYAADPQRYIRRVISFQSEHFRSLDGTTPAETWTMERMGWSTVEWTPAVKLDGLNDVAASLRLMREWMLVGPSTPVDVIRRDELQPPKAMIAVGGMEGVRDEAALFLQQRLKWNVSPLPSIYAFASCGGAAARLLEPARKWPERLWQGKPLDSEALAILSQPSASVIGIEEEWRRTTSPTLPKDLPFQPYAAMAQWLMDSLG